MKLNKESKYFKWGLTAFLVVAAVMVLYMLLQEADGLSGAIGSITGAFSTVLLGVVFAYLINPLLKIVEKFCKKVAAKIYKKEKHVQIVARAHALSLVAIMVVAVITLAILFLVPKIYDSIMAIASNLPDYYNKAYAIITDLVNENSTAGKMIVGALNNISESVNSWFTSGFVAQLTTVLESAISGIYGVVISIVDVVVALVIAIYILADKERLAAQGKKLCYSFKSTEKATAFIKNLTRIDKIFTGFLSARILDSIIILILTYIVMLIFDLPYKELISVIVGVTNVIPFFGPFIGAIPSALLILLVDPLDCLVFVIAILILQQLDSNIVCPIIVGKSTGLSGFWVLCSTLIFGGLFGFLGMLIGVPTFAAIYAFIKEKMYEKLDGKDISHSTEDFKKISYIDPETNEPIQRNK